MGGLARTVRPCLSRQNRNRVQGNMTRPYRSSEASRAAQWVNLQRARVALALHPRCGAHSRRTGRPCRGMAMSNGRCRLHGGGRKGKPGALNPAYKHGLRSKEYIEQRREARKLLRSVRALIDQANGKT